MTSRQYLSTLPLNDALCGATRLPSVTRLFPLPKLDTMIALCREARDDLLHDLKRNPELREDRWRVHRDPCLYALDARGERLNDGDWCGWHRRKSDVEVLLQRFPDAHEIVVDGGINVAANLADYEASNYTPSVWQATIWKRDAPVYSRDDLDDIVRRRTGFSCLADLLNAKGRYRPSIDMADTEMTALATYYDKEMERRGDARRAFRYGNRASAEPAPLTGGQLTLSQGMPNQRTADLQRLRDLCARAGISLVEALDDAVRGRWDWRDEHGNASNMSLDSEWAAAVAGLEATFGDAWRQDAGAEPRQGLIHYIESVLPAPEVVITPADASPVTPEALAQQLVARYREIADCEADVPGEQLHAHMAKGALSEYFDPNTGGWIWLSHSVHQAEGGNVLVTAGLDSVGVFRAPSDDAQACADAVYALCGEDAQIRLAEWYYEAPRGPAHDEEPEAPRP